MTHGKISRRRQKVIDGKKLVDYIMPRLVLAYSLTLSFKSDKFSHKLDNYASLSKCSAIGFMIDFLFETLTFPFPSFSVNRNNSPSAVSKF